MSLALGLNLTLTGSNASWKPPSCSEHHASRKQRRPGLGLHGLAGARAHQLLWAARGQPVKQGRRAQDDAAAAATQRCPGLRVWTGPEPARVRRAPTARPGRTLRRDCSSSTASPDQPKEPNTPQGRSLAPSSRSTAPSAVDTCTRHSMPQIAPEAAQAATERPWVPASLTGACCGWPCTRGSARAQGAHAAWLLDCWGRQAHFSMPTFAAKDQRSMLHAHGRDAGAASKALHHARGVACLRGHVAAQGGGADDKALAALDGRDNVIQLLVLQVECLHTHACAVSGRAWDCAMHTADALDRVPGLGSTGAAVRCMVCRVSRRTHQPW